MAKIVEPVIGKRDLRREDRRQAIIAVADVQFREQGYAATSMSTIAAALGGSKTTLWSYFPSKEALFAAVLDVRIAGFAEALEQALVLSGGTAAALTRFGRTFLNKILADPSASLHRMLLAEADKFPELGRMFLERGPRRVKQRLADFIAGEMTAGRLRSGDPLVAARLFVAMCQSGAYYERLWVPISAGDIDIERDVTCAVDAFMRAWAPEQDGSPLPT